MKATLKMENQQDPQPLSQLAMGLESGHILHVTGKLQQPGEMEGGWTYMLH